MPGLDAGQCPHWDSWSGDPWKFPGIQSVNQ